MTRSNEVRDRLYGLMNPEASEAEQQAMVNEFFAQLTNDLHPQTAPIEQVTVQDRADSEHLRLKPYQVSALLSAPGLGTLRGLRDTALMTLMVCSGIRAAEAAALHVDDLRQHLGGELSLRVREGKGVKQRLILRTAGLVLDVCGWLARSWRLAGGRGLPRHTARRQILREQGIGAWSVNDIMNRYPISLGGGLRVVKPHDLRRTYARNAYDFGMDLERIRQNLGIPACRRRRLTLARWTGASATRPICSARRTSWRGCGRCWGLRRTNWQRLQPPPAHPARWPG